MNEEQLKQLKEHLKLVVEDTVNGKIDSLREELKPILDLYKATNTLGKGVVWLSKIIFSVGIIAGSIYAFLRFFK